MRLLWSFLTIGFGVYLGFALLLFLFQERFIFFPTSHLGATPQAIGLTYESVRLTTGDGVGLHGWYLPAAEPEKTLLFFHGNAGNISDRLESLEIFHRLGLNCLIIDYRGYGESEGKPSEEGLYLDAEAAWRYLTETRGVPAERIVIFGRSLGGGVASWLANKHSPSALIIESGFSSVPELAKKYYPYLPVRLIARMRFDTLQRVKSIHAPLLVVHSREDELIPFEHGERIHAAANDPKSLLTIRGGHNDGFFVSGEEYVRGLARFIENPERANDGAP